MVKISLDDAMTARTLALELAAKHRDAAGWAMDHESASDYDARRQRSTEKAATLEALGQRLDKAITAALAAAARRS